MESLGAPARKGGSGIVPWDCARCGVRHVTGAGFSPSAPWRDALGRGFGQNTPVFADLRRFTPFPALVTPGTPKNRSYGERGGRESLSVRERVPADRGFEPFWTRFGHSDPRNGRKWLKNGDRATGTGTGA